MAIMQNELKSWATVVCAEARTRHLWTGNTTIAEADQLIEHAKKAAAIGFENDENVKRFLELGERRPKERSPGATLWINDAPIETIGDHGHRYDEKRTRQVQVSFVALDGTAVRVGFDPKTAMVQIQDVTEKK